MEKFRRLKLSEELLASIERLKFVEPSEIQEKAIPIILEGKDVLGNSATGSGKTLAFGSGIIEKARKGEGIQALILTPTRELAEQVANSLRHFSVHKGLKVIDIFGGVSIEPQIRGLERADVVVGTPGRILDHLTRRTLNLSKVKLLVLDEADRMLEMGFIEDVEKIIERCPKERQTLLFSATISSDIEFMSRKYMKDPVRVSVDSYVDPSKLTQVFYDAPQNMKFSLLVHLLKQEKSGLIMVFCNTRRNVDLISRNLKRYELDSLPIHGGLTQNKRSNTMRAFNSSHVQILICTDVAARGLDIKDVTHVYNYDVPKTRQEYIHRIGRTARAGKDGKAISLVSQRDYNEFRRILEDSSLNIKQEKMPELKPLDVSFKSHDSHSRFRSERRPEGRERPRRHGERSSFGRSDRPRFGDRGRSDNRDRPRQGRNDGRSRFSTRERSGRFSGNKDRTGRRSGFGRPRSDRPRFGSRDRRPRRY